MKTQSVYLFILRIFLTFATFITDYSSHSADTNKVEKIVFILNVNKYRKITNIVSLYISRYKSKTYIKGIKEAVNFTSFYDRIKYLGLLL